MLGMVPARKCSSGGLELIYIDINDSGFPNNFATLDYQSLPKQIQCWNAHVEIPPLTSV